MRETLGILCKTFDVDSNATSYEATAEITTAPTSNTLKP